MKKEQVLSIIKKSKRLLKLKQLQKQNSTVPALSGCDCKSVVILLQYAAYAEL